MASRNMPADKSGSCIKQVVMDSGMDQQIGSVETGIIADLMVRDGDVLSDITGHHNTSGLTGL